MRLEDLMERAAQYDENLARDIKDYECRNLYHEQKCNSDGC